MSAPYKKGVSRGSPRGPASPKLAERPQESLATALSEALSKKHSRGRFDSLIGGP